MPVLMSLDGIRIRILSTITNKLIRPSVITRFYTMVALIRDTFFYHRTTFYQGGSTDSQLLFAG